VVNDDDSYHHFATSNFQKILTFLVEIAFFSGVFVAAAMHLTSPDCDRCPVVSLYT
jgi:hypothetical protein